MNKFKYSSATDCIYPVDCLDLYEELPKDLVDLTEYEYKVHSGIIKLPEGKCRKKHHHPFVIEDLPAPTETEVAQTEYIWAKSEIESITIQLEKHADKSSRAIATEQEWRDYREALRNYATVNEDGVYSLRTEKPVRPS